MDGSMDESESVMWVGRIEPGKKHLFRLGVFGFFFFGFFLYKDANFWGGGGGLLMAAPLLFSFILE